MVPNYMHPHIKTITVYTQEQNTKILSNHITLAARAWFHTEGRPWNSCPRNFEIEVIIIAVYMSEHKYVS